ncbi:hypothetical protein HN499_03155 [archaeon]|jgi:hypothetical protein|nr:hypothetical protein [archaeon]
MPLEIIFEGTKEEKDFAQKTIYPFEDLTTMRDRFLDLITLGKAEYTAMGKGETITGNVPVIVEPVKENGNYLKVDSLFDSTLCRKTVLSLKPVSGELSFNGNDLDKIKIYSADKEKILFSYGIRDHHNEDKVMAIQLFYRSEAQADSAR